MKKIVNLVLIVVSILITHNTYSNASSETVSVQTTHQEQVSPTGETESEMHKRHAQEELTQQEAEKNAAQIESAKQRILQQRNLLDQRITMSQRHEQELASLQEPQAPLVIEDKDTVQENEPVQQTENMQENQSIQDDQEDMQHESVPEQQNDINENPLIAQNEQFQSIPLRSREEAQQQSWVRNFVQKLANPIDTMKAFFAKYGTTADLSATEVEQSKEEVTTVIQNEEQKGHSLSEIQEAVNRLLSKAGTAITQWFEEVMYEHKHKISFNRQRKQLKSDYQTNKNDLLQEKQKMLDDLKSRHAKELKGKEQSHKRRMRSLENKHRRKADQVKQLDYDVNKLKKTQKAQQNEAEQNHKQTIKNIQTKHQSTIQAIEQAWNQSLASLDQKYQEAQTGLNQNIKNQIIADQDPDLRQTDIDRKIANETRNHSIAQHKIDSDETAELAYREHNHTYEKMNTNKKHNNKIKKLDDDFAEVTQAIQSGYNDDRDTALKKHQTQLAKIENKPSAVAANNNEIV